MLGEILTAPAAQAVRRASLLTLPSGWQRVAVPLAIGLGLFTAAFLTVSVIALRRARAQDIPETVRALAQLLPFGRPTAPVAPPVTDDDHEPAR